MPFCINCEQWVSKGKKICPNCGLDPDKKIVKKEPKEKKGKDIQLELSEDDKCFISRILKEKDYFEVCANCSGWELTIPPTGIDVFPGRYASAKLYCKTCGYEGTPILFSNLEDYETFFISRRKDYKEKTNQLEPTYGLSPAFRKKKEYKPYTALILNIIVVGVGQAYNDQRRKGLIIFMIVYGLAYIILYSFSFVVDILGDVFKRGLTDLRDYRDSYIHLCTN